MDEPTPRPSHDPTPDAPRRPPWKRAAKQAALAGAAVVVAGAVGLGGLAAAWRSEAGSRWLLRHLPGVTAVDVQGSFGGGELRVGSLHAVEADTQVDVVGLRLRGLALRWRPHPGLWLGVSLDDLDADSVRIATKPGPAKAGSATAPTTLRSPVALDVANLRIGTLAVGDGAPLRDVRAALALGADGGRQHRVDRLSFDWERVHAEGRATAQADAPLAIAVALAAHDKPDPAADATAATAAVPAAATAVPASGASAPAAHALPHWQASATLQGPLAGFDASARLQGEALPGRAAPQAQASAHVTPFAPLPVSAVLLQTAELDLGALSAGAPSTRLAGTVRVATTQPAAVDIDLRNLAPAAWSAGGLPFSALTARLAAPWDGSSLDIPALRLALADAPGAQGAGGELRLQGHWQGANAQVELDLDQVQPRRLDAHLGAWRIGGPLKVEFEHLPTPSSLWGGTPATAASTRAGTAQAASAAGAPPLVAPLPANFADAIVHLTGRLAGNAPPPGDGKGAAAPPAMSLQLDALLRADALQLARLDLKAGGASASAQGALSRASDGRWQGDLHAQWAQLDPGAWWRLADAGPLRTGPNLLNGTFTAQLAGAPPTWQGLAAIRGKVEATLAASRLGGLPLEGRATLDATATPWTLTAELHSDANQARVEGRLRPGDASAAALAVIEQLHLSVDAPALAALAPLAGGPAAAPPAVAAHAVAQTAASTAASTTTSTTANTATTVPWPTRGAAHLDLLLTDARLALSNAGLRDTAVRPMHLVTTGALTDWAGPGLRLNRLEWSADASGDPAAPLSASVTLRDAQWGVAHVNRVEATLAGTLAEHRLQVQADAPVSPPLWLAHLADIGGAEATRLDLLLQGRWRPDARDAPAWQGHLAQLDLRAADAAQPAASAASAGASGAHPAAAPASGASSASVAVAGHPAWIHLSPVDLSLSRDAAGAWQTLRVGPGQATIAGLGLGWSASSWTAPVTPGGNAHWTVDATLSPFSVAQLLARAQPDLGWHGDLQMAARLHAAFDGQWHIDGQLARTSGDLSVSELAQDSDSTRQALGLGAALLTVKAEGARWQADADVAGTRLGELSGHWTTEAPSPASLPTADSPLHGEVKAHVADLNVWGAWLPPGWRLGGEMRTELALAGRWGAPQITGDVTARQLVIRNALEGVYGHDGDIMIRLAGDHATIERFHLYGGNGELALTGTASLGAVPAARVQMQATRFQLLGRIDRKLVTTGTMNLQFAADAMKIDGKLAFDEGLFDISRGDAPTLDSDVDVVNPNGTTTTPADTDNPDPAAAAPRTNRTTTIALDIDLGQHLQLRGRGIDTSLRGALQITAPNGLLAVHGSVHTNGGTYKAYGQKLDIARGEITFTGPVADPRLDILATRPNLDVVVGVAITGTALAPHVKLYSDPDMTDTYKLSWLMLGREPDTVGGADTALLQQAAIALLAGEDEAPTDQLLKRLGLTDFGVNQQTTQTDTGNVKQTVVSLGRQLSRRWYVGYARNVNETTGNWQLIYRIAQRFTLRAQSGQDNSLDVIYTWRWN